ncbi:MAG TPA: ABC transporter permease, partial [Gemmatimonadaceae bacterium]|nr:ABC transporter permease [Gemmatimonadaceae bacterium]
MSLFEAIRLALSQIRVQKLKSVFTLMGVTIGVMFLVAVVAVVNGMSKYVEDDFAGKFLGINTFNLRRFPDIGGDVSEKTWREWKQRPVITVDDAQAVREGLPPQVRWAIQDARWVSPRSEYSKGGPQVMLEGV